MARACGCSCVGVFVSSLFFQIFRTSMACAGGRSGNNRGARCVLGAAIPENWIVGRYSAGGDVQISFRSHHPFSHS